MASVFVSYAHVDNQAFSGEEKGWITHFVNNLRGEVNRKIGREENYSLWMDFRLKGNDELTLELEKQVKAAQSLLLFLSPGWLASEWCQRELGLFLEDGGKQQYSGRFFVVELDRVEKPETIRGPPGYRFWQKTDQDKIRKLGYPVPQPTRQDHSSYFDRLFDLADDLAAKLKETNTGPSQSIAPTKATVYVAPVGDALYEQRSNLITELRQFGIDPIPPNNALDLDSFKQATERDLAQCSHFIQLLDADWNLGVPAKQLQMAESSRKPILQWRGGRELEYTKAREEQKKLLEGRHVITCALSEFAQHVRRAVLPEPEPEPEEGPEVAMPLTTQQMVFVHTGQQDLELAKKIAGGLISKGYGYALPRYSGDPASIRKSIERGLTRCNVLLMLQRETPAEVMEDFLSEAHLSSLDGRHLSMLMCRTQEAEALAFSPPGLRLLHCNGCVDFSDYCLEQFLQAVDA